MDKRGQISIEFVLIIGFMLVLVLLFGSYAGDATEKSTVSAAAKSGAMDAASNLFLNKTITEPVRVTDISSNESGQNITLLINISGPISNNTNQTITYRTLQSIAAQGYTLDTTNASDPFVSTSRHIYRVIIV